MRDVVGLFCVLVLLQGLGRKHLTDTSFLHPSRLNFVV